MREVTLEGGKHIVLALETRHNEERSNKDEGPRTEIAVKHRIIL